MKKEKYSVNCGKCGKEFTSTNELDTDNEGKCPSCKKDGKVRLPEGQLSAEAICHTCGNIYDVKKPNNNLKYGN